MRVLLVLFVAALAGCTSTAVQVHSPTLPDDIPAPPPEDDFQAVEYIEPAKGLAQVEVKGRVLDVQGNPVKGTLLWIEGADLREPANNLGTYLDRRAETLLRTGADGSYRFVLDEGLFAIAAKAPGHYLQRFQPELDASVDQHDIVMRPQVVEVVGHRGAYYYAPENTEASFMKAVWLGIDIVEVDVRVTKDNVLVVIHDRNLQRTTGHDGEVHETDYATIAKLDAGSWFGDDFAGQRVPTLEQVFAWAESYDVGLALDLKPPLDNVEATQRTWQGTLDAIERWGFEDRVIFGSFAAEGVATCVARATIRCATMTNDQARHRTIIQDTAELGASMVMLRRTMADALLVEEARRAGIAVHVWGLNSPADWYRMQLLGIHSWGTDRPGYVLDHLNAR